MNNDNKADRPAGKRPLRSWPLYFLAAPAGVAVWSGWVGLGEMTGFGKVHPLPGIADGFEINTAITLPVGVEAYAAYALGVWLSRKSLSAETLAFARRSAIGALILGGLGQVAYHLLAAAGRPHAPIWVTTIVACFPVAVLGLGTTLAHLVHRDARSEPEAEPNHVQVQVQDVRWTGLEPEVQVPVRVEPEPVRNLPTICSRSINANRNLNQRLANPNLNLNRSEPEPRREPEPVRNTNPRPAPAGELGDRAAKKRAEVQQVLNLIEEHGFDEVSLQVVQNRLNHLSKTTAYNRLIDARNKWNQGTAS